MNARFHSRILSKTICTAALGLSLAPLMMSGISTAVAGPAGTYAGSDLWYVAMRKEPTTQAMLRELAHTNVVLVVPSDCVEVAGTVTFPQGNPFPDGNVPELQIYCRDQSADAYARKVHLDGSGHFYTIFKRGQRYDFYWKMQGGRERFCSLQVGSDARTQQKLVIAYPPAQKEQASADDAALAGRDGQTLANEYDLSGFPGHPVSDETKRIAEAIRVSTSTGSRANAHEMLARYYQDKGDSARAGAEFKKAKELREGK